MLVLLPSIEPFFDLKIEIVELALSCGAGDSVPSE